MKKFLWMIIYLQKINVHCSEKPSKFMTLIEREIDTLNKTAI